VLIWSILSASGLSPCSYYQQNGFTNYTNQWVGGVVFCPLTKERAVKWQMMSNDSQIKSTQNVVSIGTLIGWF
jgi:hypothetical protein